MLPYFFVSLLPVYQLDSLLSDPPVPSPISCPTTSGCKRLLLLDFTVKQQPDLLPVIDGWIAPVSGPFYSQERAFSLFDESIQLLTTETCMAQMLFFFTDCFTFTSSSIMCLHVWAICWPLLFPCDKWMAALIMRFL